MPANVGVMFYMWTTKCILFFLQTFR